jgi:plastocyanin
MDTLDSRALRSTDCYAQRFMKPGDYPYNVLPVMGHCISMERPFSIRVADSGTKGRMTQHTVFVTFEAGRFKVDQEHLSIGAGDLVLWNCTGGKAIPYTVVGDKEFFSSHRLVNESGYSHAFGSAGDYEWKDAYGTSLSGIVRVKDPDCKETGDYQRWHKLLSKGTLVTISGTSAEPREVAIFTGQTIFFIVTKGPGISITDRRLLPSEDQKRKAV